MGKVMIIAEAGVNHNGKLELALRLCDEAKHAGADIVKFQTWVTERVITKDVPMADYQELNTGVHVSQFDMLKRLELSYADFRAIKEYCDTIGIVFASTADVPEDLDFLVGLGIPFIKIGSGDVGNVSFLRYAGKFNLPIILSTGMSSLSDIELSVSALKAGGAQHITLLHCTTNYPCPYDEVNLNAIQTIKDAFHLPVGYSDHTLGTEVAVSAVALGATVIEKHFTIDRKMIGPDHRASIEPEELKQMVRQIRHIEMAMGDGLKKMSFSEKKLKNVVTKRIVAASFIAKGEILSEENICIKRSPSGADASQWDRVVGTYADRDYSLDQGIII